MTTFLTLRDYIPDQLMARNSELATTAVVDQVINDAQRRLIEDLEGNEAFTGSLSTMALPTTGVFDLSAVDGLTDVHHVLANGVTELEHRDFAAAMALYGGGIGTPKAYATSTAAFVYRVFPAPAPPSGFPLTIIADIRPPLLTAAQPTGVLTQRFERVLLASCLLQGAMFMRDFGAIEALYKPAYVEALMAATMRLGRRRRDRTGVRRRVTSNVTGPPQ